MNRFALLCSFFCLLFLLGGCSRPKSGSDGEPAKRPLEGLKLRLAVADDPALAAAVVRLRGEWNAQTGAELQVRQIAEKDLLQGDALPADAVLAPSHLLGVLAERKLLAAVPPAILSGAEWGDIFELLKLREAAWGGQIMAVPFGSPLLTCCYRADLLEKLGRKPPRNWTEYEELAKLLAAQKPAGSTAWSGAIEPLAPGWAGLVLLARAAAYAKHRDNYSALFNVETMEPLVAGPPILHALEELVAAAKLGPAEPLKYDPATARAAFWKGQCGMVLTWPTAAKAERAAGGKEREEGVNPTGSSGNHPRQSRSAYSGGVCRVARRIASFQPQQPRLGQAGGRRRSARAAAGRRRPLGPGGREIGPQRCGFSVALVALR